MKTTLHLTALFIGLSMLACRDNPRAEAAAEPTSAEASPAASTPEIEALHREIEQREQTIGDLEAVVVMERAKVEENPDYDQSFLNESLHEQENERVEIERARKRLEKLESSAE